MSYDDEELEERGFKMNLDNDDGVADDDLMESLEENPKKGKPVGQVGGIVIKELKYGKFRFYFITDGFKLKFLEIQELNELLIKFVRMSDKKTQQKTIEEIKIVLKNFGKEGFN